LWQDPAEDETSEEANSAGTATAAASLIPSSSKDPEQRAQNKTAIELLSKYLGNYNILMYSNLLGVTGVGVGDAPVTVLLLPDIRPIQKPDIRPDVLMVCKISNKCIKTALTIIGFC
jgi:hypothetical protein